MPSDRFAITYSIKNEARILPFVIPLGRALGCSKFFIFFDGTSDHSREFLSLEDDIVSMESIKPSQLSKRPVWIEKISQFWPKNMDVRKRINTYYAAQLAAEDGIEWLLSIDPDEVPLPSLTDGLCSDSLALFLRTVPEKYSQILLPNHEVIPRQIAVRNPFLECTSFTNRFSATRQANRYMRAGIRAIIKNPRAVAWTTYLLYLNRFRGIYPPLMRDPITQELIPRGYLLGYTNHKSFIRTRATPTLEFDVHHWRAPNGHIRSLTAGALLHYDLYDVECARAKFRERPPANCFNGEFHRARIAHIARNYSREDFEEFFRKSILIEDDLIAKRLADSAILLPVKTVSKLYQTTCRDLSFTRKHVSDARH